MRSARGRGRDGHKHFPHLRLQGQDRAETGYLVVRVPALPLGQWNSPGRPYCPLISGPASARPILSQAPKGTGPPTALRGTVALPRKEQEKKPAYPFKSQVHDPYLEGMALGARRVSTEPPPPPALHRLGCSAAGLWGGGRTQSCQKRCRGCGPKCIGRLCSSGTWTGAKS